MTSIDVKRAWLALATAFVAVGFVFQSWPDLDLWISGLFFDGTNGFALASSSTANALRHGIWNISIALVLIAVAGLIAGLAGWVSATLKRKFGLIVALYVLGPGVLVNGILKAHWGRARPADVTEFGGSSAFTPPWPPADQCVANCSFVSGEGSAAAALFVSLLLFLPEVRSRLPRWCAPVYLASAFIVSVTGVALRVAMGRHFASDTAFAVIFVLAIALALYAWIFHQRASRN